MSDTPTPNNLPERLRLWLPRVETGRHPNLMLDDIAEAADEIERLTVSRDEWKQHALRGAIDLGKAANEIEVLREKRAEWEDHAWTEAADADRLKSVVAEQAAQLARFVITTDEVLDAKGDAHWGWYLTENKEKT